MDFSKMHFLTISVKNEEKKSAFCYVKIFIQDNVLLYNYTKYAICSLKCPVRGTPTEDVSYVLPVGCILASSAA